MYYNLRKANLGFDNEQRCWEESRLMKGAVLGREPVNGRGSMGGGCTWQH